MAATASASSALFMGHAIESKGCEEDPEVTLVSVSVALGAECALAEGFHLHKACEPILSESRFHARSHRQPEVGCFWSIGRAALENQVARSEGAQRPVLCNQT